MRRSAWVLSLTVGLLAGQTTASLGYEFIPDPCSGSPLKWARPPLFQTFMTRDWQAYEVFFSSIRRSMYTWQDVPVSFYFPEIGGYLDPPGYGDGFNQIVFVNPGYDAFTWPNYWRWEPEKVAVTLPIYNRCRATFLETDIYVNGTNWLWADGAIAGRIDFQSAVTHELGHVAGLDETVYRYSTMLGRVPAGTTWMRTLHFDDIHGARLLYPDMAFNPTGYVFTNTDRYSTGIDGYVEVHGSIWRGIANNVVDVYIAVELPNGQLYYRTPAGSWSPTPAKFAANWPVSNTDGVFLFTHWFSASDPPGKYKLYGALFKPGVVIKDLRLWDVTRYTLFWTTITFTPGSTTVSDGGSPS